MALCECGCGKDAGLVAKTNKKQGVVKGQPKRFLPHHHTAPGRPRPTRVKSVRWLEDENGCWIWQLAVGNEGYGVEKGPNGTRRVHKHNWELIHGPVPEGLILDHLCKNRRCVNPKHLEAVTQAENVHRGDAAKLSMELAAQIREDYADGVGSYDLLAIKYSVSDSTIGSIVRHEAWKPLEEKEEICSEITNRDVSTPSLLPELMACADSLWYLQQARENP